MKSISTLWLLFFAFCGTLAAQSATIRGTVADSRGEALAGASVVVSGTDSGTSSEADGSFTLRVDPGTHTLVVTFVGFETASTSVTVAAGETAELNFALADQAILGREVVVSGSRRPEKLVESPATIETIHAREILEYPGNAAELLARQKGIDYFRAGVSGIGINVRGFNSNFNSKNLQVTDGRMSTLVATGLPFGPLNTVVKEDVERVEVILGPNATMYGPNAHNGLLNTITRDPRTSAGTTFAATVGNQSQFSGRLRHAQVVNDKLAFKLTGEWAQAEEFDYVDSVYLSRDGLPGNEVAVEEFMLDNDIESLRGEASVIFTPVRDMDFTLSTGHSNSTYLSPTNVGRNQIIDWRIHYYQLRWNYKNFFVQGYLTQSKTDDTYSIDERTKQYYRLVDAGVPPSEAAGERSFSSAARFIDASKRWNAEGQYNNTFGALEVIAGVQWQQDRANSQNSYLLEQRENAYFDGNAIVVNQVGGYGHLTYNFGNGWRVLAAARADNHEVYGFNFIPKFGLLNVGTRGTWRLTYGQGIATPTILNMFGKLFNGLILGNAEGFTVVTRDAGGEIISTRTIEPQTVEKIKTFEAGYRGQLVPNKLFIDVNSYYNINENFLSPVTVVGTATHWGDVPIEQVQPGYSALRGLVATYVNFGKVNTYGADFGATYYFTPALSGTLNYSYFEYSADEEDPANDFDKNGIVDFRDLLVNAPTHKAGAGLNYSGEKFFGNVFGRWVQAYDYFSSFQIASRTKTNPDGTPILYRGWPIVENARSNDAFNYGPLGGYFDLSLGFGYRFSRVLTAGFQVSNALNQELREFTAAPPTRRLYSVEVRVDLPAIGR